MVAPLIGDISIIINVVLIMVGAVIFLAMPPAAMLMLKKKLGFMRYKTLNLMAYDDGVLVMDAQDVSTEGMLESKGKQKGSSRSFYLARPLDDTVCVEQNKENAKRDKWLLPLFSLNGIPVGLSYIRQAVVTNPAVLLAMKAANHVDEKKASNAFEAAIKIPHAEKRGLKEKFVRINVLLPFDPKDIQRNFPKYYSEDMIHSTKMRYKNIGAESSKKDGEKMFKLLLICGVVICIVLGVLGVVAGRFI